MILVIDIGNTTIAFTGMAAKEDGQENPEFEILFEQKLPTETGRDLPRFLLEAEQLLTDQIGKTGLSDSIDADVRKEGFPISIVAISSVVPACTPAVEKLAEKICDTPPVLISSECDTGLSLARIGAPETIGADRLADSAWAAARFPLPAVTVDLGTATTINVIGYLAQDQEGGGENGKKIPAFLGGMIGAGVRTSLLALHQLTAQLPALEPEPVFPEEMIGTDTRTNMLSAAVIGTAAMIEGMADRVQEQLGTPVTLILTGGNARVVSPWIRHPFYYEPALAAKGTAVIALRETRRRRKQK